MARLHGWLTIQYVEYQHHEMMERTGEYPGPLLNCGALESALRRPANVAYYEDADLAQQVAVLIDGIATAHAFLDGNKRAAAIVGETYLDWHGWYIASPSSDDTTLGRQVEMLVESQESGAMEDFVSWLRDNLRQYTAEEWQAMGGAVEDDEDDEHQW